MIKDKFKTAHMEVAEVYSRLSSCNRLKVGSVIVQGTQILAYGFNGTPPGEDNCCEDEHGNTKSNVRHAEWNAIYKMIEEGRYCDNASLFVTTSPCACCAQLIIDFGGIREVYYKNNYRSKEGIDLLTSAGIYVEQL